MADDHKLSHQRLVIAFLILAYVATCCVSLVYCAHFDLPNSFDPRAFHILYDPDRLYKAAIVVAAFTFIALLFLFADFSFGYFVGFYLYAMILGYLWLNSFSDFHYSHQLSAISAVASGAAFLLPALFISSPVRQVYALSTRALDYMLSAILLIATATIIVGASYNFRLVSLDNIYDYRNTLEAPAIINYLVGMTSSSLLPFAFACFVMRRDRLRAGGVLLLLLLYYPITLSKVAFFTPVWLVFMVFLAKIFEARICAILSLLAPIFTGVVLHSFVKGQSGKYFTIVNYRMSAIPSTAMDVYNDFFSRHDFTYFCQISFLKSLISCPYREPLSVVMKGAYELGYYNASLFATEGIASVGPMFAPFTIFICGLVIAMGNRLSAGLPAAFILISSAVLPQVLLNVPLTTVLLTHGGGALFLLWYIMPRTILESKAVAPTTKST
jgi:hypothetical protein